MAPHATKGWRQAPTGSGRTAASCCLRQSSTRVVSGAVDASLTNTTPPNVPASSIKAQWRRRSRQACRATVGLNHESSRFATPDNAYAIPAWTTLDLGLRLTQWVQGQRWIWRLAIDNATDRRAWRVKPPTSSATATSTRSLPTAPFDSISR